LGGSEYNKRESSFHKQRGATASTEVKIRPTGAKKFVIKLDEEQAQKKKTSGP